MEKEKETYLHKWSDQFAKDIRDAKEKGQNEDKVRGQTSDWPIIETQNKPEKCQPKTLK
jgi:hypothetical protein